MKKRLFVGTFLTEADQQRLGALRQYDERLCETWKRKIRFVAAEKLHLTWLFLGNVEEESVAEIESRLSKIVQRHEHLTLNYERAAFWPNDKRPRSLVLVPPNVPPAVHSLASDIKTELREFLEKEDKHGYRPHVTLMRFGEGPRLRIQLPDWVPLERQLPLVHSIGQIDLIESHMGQAKQSYVSTRSFAL